MDAPSTPRPVTVVPGAQYRAGWLHRALLGANYRDLWTTPIAVDVLDLDAFAGGLRPAERGGGLQTRSLRFRGANGREYVFRSLDKDPSAALPPELREGIVRRVLQDQVSSFHPASAVVAARLLDATGIRHAQPRLVLLPAVAALDSYPDFAGQLGTLEERPGRGFDQTSEVTGAVEVISSERLFEKMARSADVVVDTRAFLAARLFDVFVGDRDRHRDQWRWARFGRGDAAAWEPIPRDRDMAFVKYEGLLLSLARGSAPQLVGFTASYPDMVWLNWNGREIDRRLLVGLERPAWDSVAAALQRQLTDEAIDRALAAMPEPFVRRNRVELRRTLARRRERLGEAAAEYYALLAREVDLRGTDRADLVAVTGADDGSVEVTLSRLAPGAAEPATPYLRRRFHRAETREVRIYLGDGDDRAVIRGRAVRGVTVRVVGGDGDDTLVDSAAGGERARFYDSSGDDRVVGRSRAAVDRRAYTPPPTKRAQDPPRDWGHEWMWAPWATAGPDVGLFVGAGRELTRFGFRQDPFAMRAALQAGYAIGAERPRAQVTAEYHRPNARDFVTLRLRASGIEVLRFHGLGNETAGDQPSAYYRVRQAQYLAAPALAVPLTRHTTLSVGAVAQYVSTDTRRETLVAATRPYGSDGFGELGASVGLVADTRDRPDGARRGVLVSASGSLYPPVWDVARTFGEAHASASTYLSVPSRLEPTLALRVAGQRLWGEFPFHEAAFVGGASTLRGWGEQRFAGRGSLYGNAELRLFVAHTALLVPGDVGVLGIADAGRVYASGERSNEWHVGLGGGVWVAPLTRAHTVSLAVVRGRERTGIYLRTGFAY
jgi:hypothetical protein